MPHFSECCRADKYVCQKCGRQLCSNCHPPKWRPDITGHESAGNVCPSCLTLHGNPHSSFFIDLSKHQEQIWPDACDCGYILTSDNKSKIRTKLTQLLNSTSFEKTEWKTNEKNFGTTYKLPELSLSISYIRACSAGKDVEFISIDKE